MGCGKSEGAFGQFVQDDRSSEGVEREAFSFV